MRAGYLLGLAAAIAALLCLTVRLTPGAGAGVARWPSGLVNSIMFPVIFTLTLERSSASRAATSGLLCMAIVGGAFLPRLAGLHRRSDEPARRLRGTAHRLPVYQRLWICRRPRCRQPRARPQPALRTEASLISEARQAAAGAARQLHGQLRDWLINAAYPLWARAGYDPVHGGFHERLASDGAVAEGCTPRTCCR